VQLSEARRVRAEAMLELDDGDLPEARRALDGLISELTGAGDRFRSELALAHIDRATVERFANDWDAAIGDFAAAESIASRLTPFQAQFLLTQVYGVRAKIHSTSILPVFDLTRAQSDLEKLRALWPGTWMVEELESHIAFQRRDWDQAAAAALRAVPLIEKEGFARGVAACRRRAGEAFLELGRLDAADAQLSAAREFFDRHGPPDLVSETYLVLARLESRRQHHDEAWMLARRVLDEVESRVRRFADAAGQQRFLLDKLRIYDTAFDIGLARGDREGWRRAWTVAERSKSFYLAQLLANADVPLFDGVDPSVVSAIEALEAELDSTERKLGNLDGPARGGPAEQELEARLRELSAERQAKLQTIMQANPRWARLRNPDAFDAAELASKLPAGVAPIGFYWRSTPGGTAPDGATLHVFARSASGGTLHDAVAWDRAQLDELARHAQRLHGQVDDYADLLPDGMTDRVLPPAIRDQLPADACLLISPHGRLRGLPLHALPLDDSIVIARWAVQYVPGLALPPPAARTQAGQSILLMGSARNAFGDPPLPDVGLELSELEQLWMTASRTVVSKSLDADATPEDAGWPPTKWSEFGVLHFACHGHFTDGRPLDSALRLGRDAVRGSELFAATLRAPVVALSACALGQRAERYGDAEVVSEEWIGLYLPLFYAGARALVVSLWDAHSGVARQFMVVFHQALADGRAPHEAFRSAMLRVRMQLPARWANWCLVGLPG
jgi:CHAT domain-containing protein